MSKVCSVTVLVLIPLASLAIFSTHETVAAEPQFQKLAYFGDVLPAPSTPGSVSGYVTAMQSRRGPYAVYARSQLSSTSQPMTMHIGYPGAFEYVLRDGAPAPLLIPGTTISNVYWPQSLTSDGSLSFSCFVGGQTGLVIYGYNDGAFRLIARSGVPLPPEIAPSGAFYSISHAPVANEDDWRLQEFTLSGAPISAENDRVVTAFHAGQQIPFLREGGQAPGFPAGVTFTPPSDRESPFAGISIGDGSTTMARAFVSGPGVSTSTNEVLFRGTVGSMLPFARTGDSALGYPAGSTIRSFTNGPRLTRGGDVAAAATVSGTEGTSFAYYLYGATDQVLVARHGMAAAGTQGAALDLFVVQSAPAVNSRRQTAFIAGLAGPGTNSANNRALYGGEIDNLSLLTRTGLPAPDVSDGAVISAITDVELGESGLIVFAAQLSGPGVTAANNQGVWSLDQDRNFQLLARTGTPFADANGDMPTSFGRSQINDLDEILLSVQFAGGRSGAWIVTVPEPSVAVLPIILLMRRKAQG